LESSIQVEQILPSEVDIFNQEELDDEDEFMRGISIEKDQRMGVC